MFGSEKHSSLFCNRIIHYVDLKPLTRVGLLLSKLYLLLIKLSTIGHLLALLLKWIGYTQMKGTEHQSLSRWRERESKEERKRKREREREMETEKKRERERERGRTR
jgi:hypothetical protein